MNTTEFLEREIRRAEISLRHAQRKPHTPKEELRGLRDKIACLEEALTAVQRRCLAEKPMTLEQLREMKDEPAYLKVFDPLLKSGWHIIKAVTKDKIIFRGWQTVYVPIDGMGVNYNLYRRPPEGEEET